MSLKIKYLYQEFRIFFVLAILIFIFLFMIRPLLWLMDLIINHFFTIVTVCKFFFYSFLEVSPDIVALSFFTAVIGTITRMNMEKEYWIFLTSGISGRYLFRFFAILGFVFCFIEFWLCFFVSPSSIYKSRLLINQARVDEPMKMFRAKSLIKEFPGISIYIKDIKNRTLYGVYISQRIGSNVFFTINAEKGQLQLNTMGYLYLLLDRGYFVTYSIEKPQIILKTIFEKYSFLLPYRVVSDFNPQRKPKEMNLFLLMKGLVEHSDNYLFVILFKKIFFVLLPLFYLFIGFYAGIGIKMVGYMHILGTGLLTGLVSYFVILVGEGIVYKTGNIFLFLIVPLIFIFSVMFLRKRFSNVI